MVLRVGLTGGIGSGKSTVSGALADRGAVVVDADLVAREVVAAGTAGLAAVVDRFGPGVLRPDGSLDRPTLGSVVFADERARRDLEGITHPRIGIRTAELIEAAGPDAIVVHDQPLLVEMGLAPMNHLTVVVDAPVEARLHRVMRDRGMSQADARARIAAQATDEQRYAAADALLDNSGAPQDLIQLVDSLWSDRLLPFQANLRADRRVRRDRQVPAQLTVRHEQRRRRADRMSARIRHQLDRAGIAYAGVDHIGSAAAPGLSAEDVVDLQLRVTGMVETLGADPDFRAALRAAGVVGLAPWQDTPHDRAPDPADRRTLYAGGADPAYVLQLHIRQDRSPGAQAALRVHRSG